MRCAAQDPVSRREGNPPLQVCELEPGRYEQWDRFVIEHPHGSPFHLIAWMKSIQETFGFRPLYRVAVSGGSVRGVLPLFLVRNVLMGKVLLSSPFAVYGGILADSPEALAALRDDVRALGESLEVQYVELRNAYPEQCAGFAPITRYVTFTRAVSEDEAAILPSLEKNNRYMVQKAQKHQFAMRKSTDIGAFCELLAVTYRRLGTPSFPRRHFEALVKHFGAMIDIREVVLEGKVVAASLNFLFREQVHNFNSGSDFRYKALAPNNYLYFDLLRWAGKNGYQVFDFGRSKKGTGVFEFKRHWGTTMRELPYEVLLVRRREMPNFSPANPKFGLAIKVWQRLPLAVTKRVGPVLIRLFP